MAFDHPDLQCSIESVPFLLNVSFASRITVPFSIVFNEDPNLLNLQP